jgi:hypothetical protein
MQSDPASDTDMKLLITVPTNPPTPLRPLPSKAVL